MNLRYLLTPLLLLLSVCCFGQLLDNPISFTKADTLRGSLNANRTWWNVLRYDIQVEPDYATETISGKCIIRFEPIAKGMKMQVDLQQPLVADSIFLEDNKLTFSRQGNLLLIDVSNPGLQSQLQLKTPANLTVFYHGKPQKATRPPWDGGWVWTKDAKGRPWYTVACQGLGASVWYPCKDHQSDEPDQGASLTIIAPEPLTAVANGRLISKIKTGNKTSWRWEVKNPINNYNIIPYVGHYESIQENYAGEEGQLACTYWVLDYEMEKAKEQFKQVMPMLYCFEKWFGPYPFYEDGYQLIQSSHLGMEHQSGIAYGNGFQNGYRGRDLSQTGWGNLWDYIIIHESGHEWFGNNITCKDNADMWIHEGFTSYSETIFTECLSGVQAGNEYMQGLRGRIRNDRPMIGQYGVNNEGSGDMYAKGANLVHTIRTLMQNDSLFRQMLRQMNKTFYHQTVTSQQIEDFIQQYASFNCRPIFDQYLRQVNIPALEWKLKGSKLQVRFSDCLPAFAMHVWLPTALNKGVWKTVRYNQWTTVSSGLDANATLAAFNKNLYVKYERVY